MIEYVCKIIFLSVNHSGSKDADSGRDECDGLGAGHGDLRAGGDWREFWKYDVSNIEVYSFGKIGRFGRTTNKTEEKKTGQFTSIR